MKNYKLSRLPSKTVAIFALLDIEYPLPLRGYKKCVSPESFDPASVLFWLQNYLAGLTEGWLHYEPAMQRLCKICATERVSATEAFIDGDIWSLKIGSVDLAQKIVTIQRNSCLLAAIQNQGNGKLIASVYHPLDSKSISSLLSLSQHPSDDGSVCMSEVVGVSETA